MISQQRFMGYRRPGRTAILPPPKVVRCLMPLYYPIFGVTTPIFTVNTSIFCHYHPHFAAPSDCRPWLSAPRYTIVIGYWCDAVVSSFVCPSVCLWRSVLCERYILKQNCEQVNRKCPLGTQGMASRFNQSVLTKFWWEDGLIWSRLTPMPPPVIDQGILTDTPVWVYHN